MHRSQQASSRLSQREHETQPGRGCEIRECPERRGRVKPQPPDAPDQEYEPQSESWQQLDQIPSQEPEERAEPRAEQRAQQESPNADQKKSSQSGPESQQGQKELCEEQEQEPSLEVQVTK